MSSAELLAASSGLAAALCWSSSSLIFGSVRVRAVELNTAKNLLAALGFVVTLLALRGTGAGFSTATAGQWGWLAASSVVGIVIGDYAYFRSLQILGPRRALVLTLAVPPLAAIAAAAVLDESLVLQHWLGMAITLFGILVVILERTGQSESAGHFPGSLKLGLFFGALGALGQAGGSVLTKIALVPSDVAPEVAPLEASFIRLAVAGAVGLGMSFTSRRKDHSWAELATPRIGGRVALAALVGTYAGIYLSLVAYAGTNLGVATTMTSMAPVFVIPLVRIFHKVRISPRAVVGCAIAIGGVVVLVSSGPRAEEESRSAASGPGIEPPRVESPAGAD